MNAPVIPFAFKDQLVRVVKPNGEPWFVGRDVCRVLDIKNESHALGRLDADERQDGVAISDPMGREQTVVVISEAGCYRLIFSSRKEEAEVFKRWLAHEVLPALRKQGFYAVPGAAAALPSPEEGPTGALNAKIALVREARLLFGLERARALWPQLELPPVPDVPGPADDARALLRHLLAQPLVFDAQDRPVRTVGETINSCIEDAGDNWPVLTDNGIRVVAESNRLGFVVANNHHKIAAWLHPTPWRTHWAGILRRYPGAARTEPMKFSMIAQRGTFVPVDALDDPAVTKPIN